MSVSLWSIAAGILVVSCLLRAMRLHISLGMLRPAFRTTCAMHFSGVALGYLTLAMAYEGIVLAACSRKSRGNIFPVLYSLMILRSFDAVALLVFALIAMPMQDIRFLSLFLLMLIVLIWVVVYGIEPIIARFERNILTYPAPFAGDRRLLRWACHFRQSLKLLPWKRRGTLAIIVVLSLGSWFLEWLTLYVFLDAARPAALAIVDRVGVSLGLLPQALTRGYAELMPAVYGTSVALLLYLGLRGMTKRRNRS